MRPISIKMIQEAIQKVNTGNSGDGGGGGRGGLAGVERWVRLEKRSEEIQGAEVLG